MSIADLWGQKSKWKLFGSELACVGPLSVMEGLLAEVSDQAEVLAGLEQQRPTDAPSKSRSDHSSLSRMAPIAAQSAHSQLAWGASC